LIDVSNAIEQTYKSCFCLYLSIAQKSYGLDQETAKDRIQETFIKVLQNKHTIREKNEASIRCFTIRVFRNTCISHLRKKDPLAEKSYPMDHQDQTRKDPIEENVASTQDDPLYTILLIEEMRLREEAINRLPPKYRETVRFTLEGIKRKDIAKRLDIKETSIHNIKHRGLKKYATIINSLDPSRKM